jgi:hypothetical protein
MKMNTKLHKKISTVMLAGAAVAVLVAAPYGMASANDTTQQPGQPVTWGQQQNGWQNQNDKNVPNNGNNQNGWQNRNNNQMKNNTNNNKLSEQEKKAKKAADKKAKKAAEKEVKQAQRDTKNKPQNNTNNQKPSWNQNQNKNQSPQPPTNGNQTNQNNQPWQSGINR